MLRFASRAVTAAVAFATAACLTVGAASAALIDLTPANGAINSVGSVTLADLQSDPSGGIVVGDKIFTGFSYSRLGDMPLPADINVLGFKDPDGNWGVSFHGIFQDMPGGSASDALIRFAVEVSPAGQQQGWQITDAHLFLGGAGAADESFITVDETFLGKNETLNAYYSTVGPGVNSKLADSTIFTTPVTKLFVTKDIYANAASGAFLPARATVIDQSFSQTLIPEPATMALAGMGGVAMVTLRRRRS
ncbi:PEP-CTERM sorting domain-containing protein [Lacipirellula parvula]|uniref:Ice-binding protein C-terminal domain-containing protein n=1 Tax=Lacipirellula parvula TaxID=2650471 RepID=A0A5K7X9W5_9BACT|nr:PEP-CTERM sorting domain-containing protein [Lacipirellula parvula]BBO31541.1 hypothetical protein PLANPX_1153 [Lacipirellula parvula]